MAAGGMRRAALGILIGILAAQQFTQLPSLWWASALPLFAVAAWRWPATRLPLWAVAGLFWAVWRADLQLGPTWPAQAMRQDAVLSGYVASIPRVTPDGARFRFRVEGASLRRQALREFPPVVRLSWYGAAPQLRPGQRWRLRVRLKPPNGFMNPGGFDYERWLFRQGIRATGYVRPHGGQRLAGLRLTPSVRLDRLRMDLAQRIAEVVPADGSGVLQALTLGIRDGIPQGRWQTLLDTGTNHLIAISGLHIGMVAAAVGLLLNRIWAAVPPLALLLAAPRAAALCALAAAGSYAALAGFTVPTQRALVMLTVVLGGVLLWRRARPADSLAAALLAVLLLDPLAVMDAGFWLSFAAVAVILYVVADRSGDAWLRSWGRVQWALLLGLLPLTALLFQRVAPVAPIANLLAVPWVGFAVVPLALCGMLLFGIWSSAGGFLLGLAGAALSALWPVLDFLAGLPGAHLRLGVPSPAALPLALCGVAWLLAPRGWPSRWIGAVMVAPLLWPPPSQPPPGEWRLSLLDVGQGMSAVVQTAHHTLVFDAGPRFSPRFDTGEAVVAPYLRSRGLRRLDLLVVSHDDNDHSGGVASVLRAYPHTRVLASNTLGWSGSEACRAGRFWIWDGVRFDMLYPSAANGGARNDRSCVLRISSAGGSALLLSDIEAEAERGLVGEWDGQLASDVMIVPHHGSATSSTGLFLDAVHPRLALLSRGFGNRFGFPKASVMQRYASRGIEVADTARSGALTVRFSRVDGVRLLPGYRTEAGRYWNRSR
ncbi:DNA internalization-related competence protein ComEC/Rec2 [Acidihalobacter prosperus]